MTDLAKEARERANATEDEAQHFYKASDGKTTHQAEYDAAMIDAKLFRALAAEVERLTEEAGDAADRESIDQQAMQASGEQLSKLLKERDTLRSRVEELEEVESSLRIAVMKMAGKYTALRTQVEELGDLRREVFLLACAMERKLKENDHKEGWSGCGREHFMLKLYEELGELANCIIHGPPKQVLDEAADVANIIMMIADTENAFIDTEADHD